MKSATFKFWVTLEFSRRHYNLKPKRFDFCIEYKPTDRTCPVHYQRLELFGLLEEISIKSCVAFLKCFNICFKLYVNIYIQSLSSDEEPLIYGSFKCTFKLSCGVRLE